MRIGKIYPHLYQSYPSLALRGSVFPFPLVMLRLTLLLEQSQLVLARSTFKLSFVELVFLSRGFDSTDSVSETRLAAHNLCFCGLVSQRIKSLLNHIPRPFDSRQILRVIEGLDDNFAVNIAGSRPHLTTSVCPAQVIYRCKLQRSFYNLSLAASSLSYEHRKESFGTCRN